jgi:hypothetical protein
MRRAVAGRIPATSAKPNAMSALLWIVSHFQAEEAGQKREHILLATALLVPDI